MIEDYLGIDFKETGLFVGTMITVVIVVTALYWFVYGFDHWNSEMNQASNMMMAANVAPLNTQNVQTNNQNLQMVPQQGYSLPQQNCPAGQYLCPTHGAVGLPIFDQMGQPHCPICNATMQFSAVSPMNTQQVAWNTGGGGGGGGGG